VVGGRGQEENEEGARAQARGQGRACTMPSGHRRSTNVGESRLSSSPCPSAPNVPCSRRKAGQGGKGGHSGGKSGGRTCASPDGGAVRTRLVTPCSVLTSPGWRQGHLVLGFHTHLAERVHLAVSGERQAVAGASRHPAARRGERAQLASWGGCCAPILLARLLEGVATPTSPSFPLRASGLELLLL
jgi:hypothetical protein